MDCAALSVRGLSVSFSRLDVVNYVSFDVRDGQTLGVIGESGCGRMATASAILDQLDPGARVDGAVMRGGVDLNQAAPGGASPTRARIAVPSWAARSRRHGDPVSAPTVGRHGAAGLATSFARRFPAELSAGQRQRTAIARALILKPEIVVGDEAVGALDVSVQAQVRNLLESLQRDEGVSDVFILRNTAAVRHISDPSVVLYLGCAMEEISAGDIRARVRHSAVCMRSDLVRARVGF